MVPGMPHRFEANPSLLSRYCFIRRILLICLLLNTTPPIAFYNNNATLLIPWPFVPFPVNWTYTAERHFFPSKNARSVHPCGHNRPFARNTALAAFVILIFRPCGTLMNRGCRYRCGKLLHLSSRSFLQPSDYLAPSPAAILCILAPPTPPWTSKRPRSRATVGHAPG